MEKIQKLFETVVTKHFVKKSQLEQNKLNEKNFILTRCIDRLHENKVLGIEEYLLQYNWYLDDPTNIYNQVFQKVAQKIREEFEDWKVTAMFSDLLEPQEESKSKKRKRKKKEKFIEKKKAENEEQQEQEKKQDPLLKVKEKIQSSSSDQEKSERTQSNKKEESEEEVNISIKTHPQQNNKKIVKNRINQYIKLYSDSLLENSNSYEKYRRIIISIFEQFLFDELKLKGKLCSYGSFQAGFALKQSDIDLVFITDPETVSLNNIHQILNVKQWAIDCKYIPATIPIIKLKVNLQCSSLAIEKLSQRNLKRVEKQLFEVDLTLSDVEEDHTGLLNTQHLKNILQNNNKIFPIFFVMKELFRRKKLNKPYRGGISSYVLVMMIYNILKFKNLCNETSYFHQINVICEYMSQKFKSFETLICCSKESMAKPDPNLHLNIEDPTTKQLLKTSAFRIKQIILELNNFVQGLNEIQNEMLEMDMKEKKKMKKVFMQRFEEKLENSKYQ